MRVPIEWLREFVELPEKLDLPDLVERLDLSGTKVENIHGGSERITGVVVSEVLKISEHPNADNLTLVEVAVGDGTTERVVCGARNLSVGDRVPLARVGAQLPELAITERTIRGQISRGMLCSGAELGISKDAGGILILHPDAELGADVVEVLGLDEPTIELEVTPNRPDCMSMVGIARELAALYGVELKVPEPAAVGSDLGHQVVVDIQDEEGCPRYLARYVEDVPVGPAPDNMVRRLLAAGFRPISAVVDVTNYVLLETGQPLHAFDAEKVSVGTIVVRRARPGEQLETLDGVTRELDTRDLVIADPTRALALAGVMGGSDSEVSAETTSVILESAAFDKRSVAFTSRRLGLRSEASARFERGSDPEAVPVAAARAMELLAASGARVDRSAVDVYPSPQARPVVTLRPSRTERILGAQISADRQVAHLRAIGLDASVARKNAIEVIVPSFRRDLAIEADLIEEVARLEGFDRLPATRPRGGYGGLTREQRLDRVLRRSLVAAGLTEAWTGSFSSPDELDALGYDDEHPGRRMVFLENPMLEQEPGLRTTLLPGLLGSVALNLARHRPPGVALFEIARVYTPAAELAEEPEMLGAVFCGERKPQTWDGEAEPWDFFAAKGVLEATVAALDAPDTSYEPLTAKPFHPSRGAAVLMEGQRVGVLGELHPEVCSAFDVPEGTVAFEIAAATLTRSRRKVARGVELPRYPSVLIDIAIVLEERVPVAKVHEVIRGAGGPTVVGARLFDVYRGSQVGEGRKSLAFALELRSDTGTLKDEDANEVRDRIVMALAERTGAELRS